MTRVNSGSGTDQLEDEAQSQIASIKAELDGGADFAALAQEHSDCPSGKSGGDLGKFGRGQMVKAFEDTTYGLDVGSTSDVIETGFGYHIIQRTG